MTLTSTQLSHNGIFKNNFRSFYLSTLSIINHTIDIKRRLNELPLILIEPENHDIHLRILTEIRELYIMDNFYNLFHFRYIVIIMTVYFVMTKKFYDM